MSLVGPIKTTDSKVRKCGGTWKYCDGQCSECAFIKISTSNKTTQIPSTITDRSNKK